MKAYGYKKNKKPHGDGCFLCTQERKHTKTVARTKAKKEIDETLKAISKKPKV